MTKIKNGDILIFNSTKPNKIFKIGDRVIFRGWMYLEDRKMPYEARKNTYAAVDFGLIKHMICDISLFITLQELREKNIDIALEI